MGYQVVAQADRILGIADNIADKKDEIWMCATDLVDWWFIYVEKKSSQVIFEF